jgi:hypothetical protein
MSTDPDRDRLEEFFDSYARLWEAGDIDGIVDRYGFPCMMICDEFVGSLGEPHELREALGRALDYYQQFAFTRAVHQVRHCEIVTDKLMRVRIAWQFFDAQEDRLMDCTIEYLLRDENEDFKVFVVLPIDEHQKMQELLMQTASQQG